LVSVARSFQKLDGTVGVGFIVPMGGIMQACIAWPDGEPTKCPPEVLGHRSIKDLGPLFPAEADVTLNGEVIGQVNATDEAGNSIAGELKVEDLNLTPEKQAELVAEVKGEAVPAEEPKPAAEIAADVPVGEVTAVETAPAQ